MLYHGVIQTHRKTFFKEGKRRAMFIMTSVSSYGHVLTKIIIRKNFDEYVSEFQVLDYLRTPI